MRDRVVLILVPVLLASCIPSAVAVGRQPPMVPQPAGIPVYTGGQIQFELNLTDRDFLPGIKQFIALFPSLLQKMSAPKAEPAAPGQKPAERGPFGMPDIDLTAFAVDLQKALGGLTRISVVVYQIPSTIRMEQIPDFYMQKLGLSKGWSSTIRVQDPKGIFRMYTKPGVEGIFQLTVKPPMVIALQTEGKVDVAKLGEVLARVVATAASSEEKQPTPAECPPDAKQGEPAPSK